MKVLHVNAHLSGGGVEHYLSQLFPLLHAHGVESLVLHGEEEEEEGKKMIMKFRPRITLNISEITELFREREREREGEMKLKIMFANYLFKKSSTL